MRPATLGVSLRFLLRFCKEHRISGFGKFHPSLADKPDVERKWLQEKWHKLDESGDGTLSFSAIRGFLKDVKKKMTDDEIKAAFADLDESGEGVSIQPVVRT
jgi:hypothetical protein